MSLRRSPRRTRALLAANRANAQQSTGPRTAPGKQRSAANLRPRRSRRMSRREREEYFAPRVPPELIWFAHPDRFWKSVQAEMVRLQRRIRERVLRRLRAQRRRHNRQPAADGRQPPRTAGQPAPLTDNRQPITVNQQPTTAQEVGA